MKAGVELIEKLATAFGPTAFEGDVARAVKEEIAGLPVDVEEDRMGNLICHLKGQEGAPRVLLSAHTDEVGFIITEIEEDGYLRFKTLGGIDESVLCGRFVTLGNEERRVDGVIAARGIHVESAEERKKAVKKEDLYIDIGTKTREESEALISRGDFGTFDTPFVRFGTGERLVSCKALDDRAGCALLVEILRAAAEKRPPLDLYFAFTVREEIGRSGARVAAQKIKPRFALVLESTAIADLPDVPRHSRVASVGKGGVISLLDRATIYDRELVDFALETAEKHGIPVQIKQYVSGGNDAGNIQRTGGGVRCFALSLPTRYLHAPAGVASLDDYAAMRDLVFAMLTEWRKDLI